MFLIGKHPYGARSISCPLGKNVTTPPQITKERCDVLVVKLKEGDTSVSEELILGHIRLSVYIAGLYSNFAAKKSRDLVCESLLALVQGTEKASKGGLKNNDFTSYVAFKMHKACGNFVYNDCLIRIPISTRCLKGLKDQEIIPEQELPNRVNVSTLSLMILDETLRNAIKTEQEMEIISLKKLGYNQQEVADILDMSQAWVNLHLNKVENRFFKGEQ
jgi:hypothetical protein